MVLLQGQTPNRTHESATIMPGRLGPHGARYAATVSEEDRSGTSAIPDPDRENLLQRWPACGRLRLGGHPLVSLESAAPS
jgi:hypothetical protein